jgi:hypothetical protein
MPLITRASKGSNLTPTEADADLVYLETLANSKAVAGAVTVVALVTKTLAAVDIGTEQQNQSGSAAVLSIDTVANSGIAWGAPTAPKVFAISATGAGATSLAALAGVTLVNVGAKAVVQNDTPLIAKQSPTLNTWLVL